ncbi:hypothetical protein F4808DRAFT_194946 [Astrocystis sublimbata]|nr:hypothetical protein F4808DRAFT_194946 [Astrocystis sublimbata]
MQFSMIKNLLLLAFAGSVVAMPLANANSNAEKREPEPLKPKIPIIIPFVYPISKTAKEAENAKSDKV